MALFDVPTGGSAVNLTSGDPAYQQAIVQQAQRNLKPAYTQALQGQQQDFANRGLDESGLAAAGEAGLNQNYLGQVGNIATQAATGGADVTLQNQRIAQQQAHEMAMEQAQIKAQQDMQQNAMNQQNSQMWTGLIGNAAGGVGSYLGGGGLGMFADLAKQSNNTPANNEALASKDNLSLGDVSMPAFSY